MAAHTSPRRPLPLRFTWQPISIRSRLLRHHPRAFTSIFPASINSPAHKINRRLTLLFALRIAPFYHIIPTYINHGKIVRSTIRISAPHSRQVTIPMPHRPIPHGFPLAPCHFIFSNLESPHRLPRQARPRRQCPALHGDHSGAWRGRRRSATYRYREGLTSITTGVEGLYSSRIVSRS